MPKHKKRGKQAPGSQRTKALVLLDEAIIRANEQRIYLRKCQELEKAAAQLLAYERQDLPAFERWRDREFSGEISDYVRLKRACDELHEHMSRMMDERDRQDSRRPDVDSEPPRFSSHETPRVKAAPDSTAKAYLKTVYRKLVRHLHPDSNEPTPERQELWHAAQAAYENHDLEKLNQLLELVTMGGEERLSYQQIPMSHLLELRRDVERRIQATKRKLAVARKNHAWNSVDIAQKPSLLAALRRKLAHEYRTNLVALREFKKDLDEQFVEFGT